MTPEFSVLISTKNRPEHLARCLQSIQAQTYRSYEVIILDQNTDDDTNVVCTVSKIRNLVYIRFMKGWKSVALNVGLKRASGKYIAFTDDDCILSPDWLKKSHAFFQKNLQSVGVFGRVKPYGTPPYGRPFHPQDIDQPSTKTVKLPHAFLFSDLGNGNNMIFRKNIFEIVGSFNEWLGVGAPCGGGGEDGELAYRILKRGYPLIYDPTILIYHNRWLTHDELRHTENIYSCGSTAFATYWMIRGGDIQLVNNYLSCLSFALHEAGMLFMGRNTRHASVFQIIELIYQSTKGIIIGILMRVDDFLNHRMIAALAGK
jgi:glycosyltransferase involved in cell wall biosynthesis